jgi:hypothetical protein
MAASVNELEVRPSAMMSSTFLGKKNPMTLVKPWARGPFEVLQHAEEHRQAHRDFDRRVALIGFDNAIESSVITYLSLNPVQRGNRSFPKADVDRWLNNFHSKVEFLEHFARLQSQVMPVGRPEIIYYHSLRNDLYHNGNGFLPAAEHIDGARQAALWAFSTLFDCDAEALLESGNDRDPKATNSTLQLSASTTFLESFIQTKNELSQLLTLMNKAVGGGASLERLLQVLQEEVEVPASVVDATVKAEEAKELVVRGDEGRIDEAALRSVASELSTVGGFFRQRLRDYQMELIDAAISSTLASVRGDGRAGIVSQVAGSGITMTLMAYLIRCRDTPELASLPYIILVDRVDAANSLIERLSDLPGSSEPIKAVIPTSALELGQTLEAPGSRLVVTTWQMVRRLRREKKFSFSCLLVCFNAVQTGTSDYDLTSLFPRGNFILFTSGPVRQDDQRFEIFGKVIGKYDFLTAVADSYLLPVRIEQHPIVTCESKLKAAVEHSATRPHEPRAEAAHTLASALLDDFRAKLQTGIRQAVLVTKSRASMTAVAHELSRLIDQHASCPGLEEISVVQLGHSSIDHHLRSGRASSVIWLSTIESLVGVDFGPSVACYVACKVLQDVQLRLLCMVARPRGDEKEAFIVDYAGNDWKSTLAELLSPAMERLPEQPPSGSSQ